MLAHRVAFDSEGLRRSARRVCGDREERIYHRRVLRPSGPVRLNHAKGSRSEDRFAYVVPPLSGRIPSATRHPGNPVSSARPERSNSARTVAEFVQNDCGSVAGTSCGSIGVRSLCGSRSGPTKPFLNCGPGYCGCWVQCELEIDWAGT